MKSLDKKKLLKRIVVTVFFIFFVSTNIVYAKTSSKIPFCDYGGVRRTFKIVGVVLNLIRIVVPLIITFIAFKSFFKIVLSGKTEDLKGGLLQITKNIVAGLIIFMLPTVLDFTFNTLVGADDSGFNACTTCLLDPDHCTIPDSDPETYQEN